MDLVNEVEQAGRLLGLERTSHRLIVVPSQSPDQQARRLFNTPQRGGK